MADKTIKQVAEELGVSKQKVYRFVKREYISEIHQRDGVMYINDELQTRIKSEFLKNDPHHEAPQNRNNNTVSEALVKLLQKELETKNEQIKELNARLAETTAALTAAQQSLQAEQALHAGTLQAQLSAGEEEPVPEKKHWWQRLKGV